MLGPPIPGLEVRMTPLKNLARIQDSPKFRGMDSRIFLGRISVLLHILLHEYLLNEVYENKAIMRRQVQI